MNSNCLLTGGTDRTLRLWDLENISSSYVLSGEDIASDNIYDRRSYASDKHDTATVYQELPVSESDSSLHRVCE